jgi:prepilin-type N-terminal cleavage/methylation domain-containing protein
MRRAFTLVEMLVVMGVVAMMLTLGFSNLLNSQRKSQMNSTLTTLTSDLREQRLKAMTGDTEGTGVISSYGIFFGTHEYTIFRGGSYVPGLGSNFIVKLDPTLTFSSVTLPASILVFADGSGEVVGYTATKNTISISDASDGTTKTITINKYGVPTSIN